MTIKENANKNFWNQHILKRTLVCSCLQSIKYQDLSSLSMKYRGGKGGFPCSSVGKEFACDAGDLGLIPGSGRSPGEGNGNPLQYSCLENPTDRGTWWATVYRVSMSWAWQKWLSSSSSILFVRKAKIAPLTIFSWKQGSSRLIWQFLCDQRTVTLILSILLLFCDPS